MSEKLKPGKTMEEFEKKAYEYLKQCHKEITEALEQAYKEGPRRGLGGYRDIEKPIEDKYYKKHIELCEEFFEKE